MRFETEIQCQRSDAAHYSFYSLFWL